MSSILLDGGIMSACSWENRSLSATDFAHCADETIIQPEKIEASGFQFIDKKIDRENIRENYPVKLGYSLEKRSACGAFGELLDGNFGEHEHLKISHNQLCDQLAVGGVVKYSVCPSFRELGHNPIDFSRQKRLCKCVFDRKMLQMI